jgi:hypothetical protein
MSNPETESLLDTIYAGYMDFKGRNENERKHPSREEFGEAVKYYAAWKSVIEDVAQKNREIFWLPQPEYNKAVFQLRGAIFNVLQDTYNIQGMGAFNDGATSALVKLAEDFSLRVRGKDHPIQVDYKNPLGG